MFCFTLIIVIIHLVRSQDSGGLFSHWVIKICMSGAVLYFEDTVTRKAGYLPSWNQLERQIMSKCISIMPGSRDISVCICWMTVEWISTVVIIRKKSRCCRWQTRKLHLFWWVREEEGGLRLRDHAMGHQELHRTVHRGLAVPWRLSIWRCGVEARNTE